MKLSFIAILALIIVSVIVLPADATIKRSPRGGPGKSTDKQTVKTEKSVQPDKEKSSETDGAIPNPVLAPEDALFKMLLNESSMGILDYKVDVVEVTENMTTKKSTTDRKEIYFLSPTRTLTIKDGIPIYYVDESIFSAIIRQVDLSFLPNTTLNGVECQVVKMVPKEEAFVKNVKHYYLAKDDNRKIRIEATRYNSDGRYIFNVTDFTYHLVNNDYNLPLKSESRIYDERDFLLQTTTSTFLNWKFNLGLKPDFFDSKLEGFKLYDVVK
jgi:hypothetical protein